MKPRNVFFGMLGLLVIVIAISTFAYTHVSSILQETTDTFAKKELELTNSYQQLSYLQNLERQTLELENSLGNLTSIYPEAKLQPEIISQLTRLAATSGVSIEGEGIAFPSVQGVPSATSQLETSETAPGLVGMPVVLSIRGNFASTMDFLKDLENFRRLVNVASVDMQSPSGSNQISSTIQIEVLVQQSLSPAASSTQEDTAP